MKAHSKFIFLIVAGAFAYAASPLQADPRGSTASHSHSGGGGSSGGGNVHVVVHHSSGGGGSARNNFPVAHISAPSRGHRAFGRYFAEYGSYGSGSVIYSQPSDNVSADSSSLYNDQDASNGDDSGAAALASATYPSAPREVPSMAASVQVALANAGYYHGAITGFIGPGSNVAIAAFQRDHHLQVNGLVDIYVLHYLGLYQ